MTDERRHELVPCIYLMDKKAVTGFGQKNLFDSGDPVRLAEWYSNHGADRLIVFDFSDSDKAHDEAIDCIREICGASRIPVSAAGNIRREEDVKKILYAGCQEAVLNGSKQSNIELLPKVSSRFGRDRIAVCISDLAEFEENKEIIEANACRLVLLTGDASDFAGKTDLPLILHSDHADEDTIAKVMLAGGATAISGNYVSNPATNLAALKNSLRRSGIVMNRLFSALPFSEFKINDAGLIPCIVQDDRTDEVLMMAWMNEESFDKTLDTGIMTYYSRSRQTLWVKGETSGHYQYVKSLSVDCDRDTLLARVDQIGAACHTGNRSCFYTALAETGSRTANPFRVFENVMDVILDRKEHPKEGSYTNYLFDKGIDKILKKVGEENTEIVIAAKNPNPEEIKYEIADYLYHLMVLMAEKGVTWNEITEELARR